MVQGLFAPRYFSSSERKFPLRTFAPGSESSRELSIQGTKVPGNFRSRVRISLHNASVDHGVSRAASSIRWRRVVCKSNVSARQMIRANTIRTIVRIICRIAQMISVLRELSWVNQIIVNLIFFLYSNNIKRYKRQWVTLSSVFSFKLGFIPKIKPSFSERTWDALCSKESLKIES